MKLQHCTFAESICCIYNHPGDWGLILFSFLLGKRCTQNISPQPDRVHNNRNPVCLQHTGHLRMFFVLILTNWKNAKRLNVPAEVCLNFSLFFFLHFQGLRRRPRVANLLRRRMGGVWVPETKDSERMAASLSTSSAVRRKGKKTRCSWRWGCRGGDILVIMQDS